MPLSAIIGHLVGDYLLQNDWMAAGKKRHDWICLAHVLAYTLAVCAFTFPACVECWWLAPAVAIPHFLIDRWTFIAWWMRLMRQPAFMEPPMSPWSRIVVDNVWHLVCLHLTFMAV
jgi:hypothetical protein